jgi:seryl-tRNA synthetase
MIDIKLLIENRKEILSALKKKHFEGDIDAIIKKYQEHKALRQKFEDLRARQNTLAKRIPELKAGGKEKLLEESRKAKEKLKELEPRLQELKEMIDIELMAIPNPPLESVPEGKDESDNEVVKTVGKKREFDFKPADHIKIGKNLDLIDTEAAADASGSRFYYLKNDLVLLEFALLQFVLQKIINKGFRPVLPPVLVKEQSMMATGFFPAEKFEIYHVNPEQDDLYLIGTSEVPLCMLHYKKILPAESLPIRYVGFSTCFRREAGTYGKDTHGIIRVHQFDKIEMFSLVAPDKSDEEHEFLLSIEEEIMQDLGFHYRIVNICGGDLGAPAAKKYDIEVFIPTQGRFRELTSCSNCTDYQARRSRIRYQDGSEKRFVYTLNGTGIATPRTLVAILENYQQKDGSVEIPEVLRPYMGGKTKIEKSA